MEAGKIVKEANITGKDSCQNRYSPDFVTIRVGGSETSSAQIFAVHKAVFCKSRLLLIADREGQFLEAETCVWTLREVDPAVFGHYVDWLYRGESMRSDDDSHVQHFCKRHLDMFLIGEKFNDIKFMGFVIKRMKLRIQRCIRDSTDIPGPEEVTKAYFSTKNRILRALLVGIYAMKVTKLSENALPMEFLAHIAIVLSERGGHICKIDANEYQAQKIEYLLDMVRLKP